MARRTRSSLTFILSMELINFHYCSPHCFSRSCERKNRKILEILRYLSGRLHETWEDWLSQVAACINTSVNSSTGKAPHCIVFGCDKKLPYDVLLQSPSPLYYPESYSKLQLHSFQTSHASVRERLKDSREEMTRKHLRATTATFNVGESVMLRSPARSYKLEPKFTGHYVITAKLHGNKFKVLDPWRFHTSTRPR